MTGHFFVQRTRVIALISAEMTIHKFPDRAQQPATLESRLHDARTEQDVVSVVSDMLATLVPAEIAELPDACHPRKISSASDVAGYAFDLVRHQYEGNTNDALVHRLMIFFARANTRLSELLTSKAGEKGSDEQRSA